MAPLLYAASVTPLRDGGEALDDAAIEPLVAHLTAEGGADGIFCCGTTGEGILLRPQERRRAAELFRAACRGPLIVHCGAQTTAETAALAAHAAETGADGAAVIPPPYFPLDDDLLVEHFAAAAAACAPLPFYLYAFAARSGYPLPPAVIERVAERADNVAGIKASEGTMDALRPYLRLGLPVYVGSEPLVADGLAEGAAGAVSGLASAFPADVGAAVRDTSPAHTARMRELRNAIPPTGFIAALKLVLGRAGLPVRPDVRAPLRPLSAAEADRVAALS